MTGARADAAAAATPAVSLRTLFGGPDAAAFAQLSLLVVGELTWLWVWSRALGLATLRAPVALVPLLALVALFALGLVAPTSVRKWARPGVARLVIAAGGVLLLVATAGAVWWGAAGPPWQYGWIPLADDALLLRGLAAGTL